MFERGPENPASNNGEESIRESIANEEAFHDAKERVGFILVDAQTRHEVERELSKWALEHRGTSFGEYMSEATQQLGDLELQERGSDLYTPGNLIKGVWEKYLALPRE